MTTAEDTRPDYLAETGTLFNAILHPYRSMGPSGFVWVMAFIGLILLVVSIVFFMLGAWPIIGFAGLDLLLIYWAFRRNYFEARAQEQILVTHKDIRLIRTSPKGERQQFAFNPYWVRIETRHEDDRGMTELSLQSHGRRVEIGAFLHACERESLAKALKQAVLDAKTANAQVSGGSN